MANSKSFHVPTDKELADLVGQMDSNNTKKTLKFAREKLLGFAKYSNTSLESLADDPSDLDPFLSKFYAGIRKEDGTNYKKRTMQTLKYGVQRHYLEESGLDITDKVKFPQSNRTFKAILVSLKKQGKGYVKHKPVISPMDMQTMQNSEELDMTTPNGLQNKVFVDIMIFFCNRGRENIRGMKPGDFTIETDVNSGLTYMKKKDCLTKNNREGQDEVSNSGRMYEIPNSNSCHIKAFQTYVSKLNPNCPWLWQRPKPTAPKDGSSWYVNSPLGVNTIGNKLKSISRNAGCSQVYTNHSLRATTINALDSAGFQSRDILSVGGHKSETSLKHSSKTCSTSSQRKKQKLDTLKNSNNKYCSAVINEETSFEELFIPPLFPSRLALNEEDEDEPELELKSDEDSHVRPTGGNLSTESNSQLSSLQEQEHEIGPYCEQAGISGANITSDFLNVSLLPTIKNGLVLEIYDHLHTMRIYSSSFLVATLKRLNDCPQANDWSVGSFIHKLVERRDRIQPKTKKGEKDLRLLYEEKFMLIRKRTVTKRRETPREKALNKTLQLVRKNLALAKKQRVETWKCLDQLEKDMRRSRQENAALSKKVTELSTENKDLRSTVSSLDEQLQQSKR